MEKWFIKNKKADFEKISREYGISEVLARLIVNRGVTGAEELKAYLDSSLSGLNRPLLMKDVEKAADILHNKIREGKKIRVVGDYDVDGIISTYLLVTALKRCKANVDYEIPDRMKDGYGINQSIIEKSHEAGIDTILTCDNGISAMEQISYAKSIGMTVIVTDHHDVSFLEEEGVKNYILPEADAIVNPKQESCEYPFKELCGAGVAYKLIEVLYQKENIEDSEAVKKIEFVSIATICDIMELTHENRIIVKNGLNQIRKTDNLGLKALIHENNLQEGQIDAYHVGFILGPCINASGRLESAKIGLKLLMSETEQEAHNLAVDLKKLNDERKDLTAQGTAEALVISESSEMTGDKVILIYLPECHESIAGIIAGRIKDSCHKPSIVLTRAAEGVKGSARSIEEYNMFEELSRCKDLLTKFGGHPMAAGLSLEEKNIELLRQRLNQNTTLTEEDLMCKVSFDMVLPLEECTLSLIEELQLLAPYGKGNAKPTFAKKGIRISKAVVLGQNKNVLRLTIAEGTGGKQFTAVMFNRVAEFEECMIAGYGEKELSKIYGGQNNKVCLDIIYDPQINEYKGYKNIQFIIKNFRVSGT